jgi:hypothetical protein
MLSRAARAALRAEPAAWRALHRGAPAWQARCPHTHRDSHLHALRLHAASWRLCGAVRSGARTRTHVGFAAG